MLIPAYVTRILDRDGRVIGTNIVETAHDVALTKGDKPFVSTYFAKKYLEDKGYIVFTGLIGDFFELQEKLFLSSDLERQEE